MFRKRIEFKGGLYMYVGEGNSPKAARDDALSKAAKSEHKFTEADITKEHDAYQVEQSNVSQVSFN